MNGLNVVVKLTTKCPGNCKCCVNRKKEIQIKEEDNSFFDIVFFEEICKKIKGLNGRYVCLSGGEPTVVPNLDDFFRIANKYGLATRINTNGWGITQERLESWLKLGLEQIVLSVYSLDEINFESIRGNKKLFYRALRATSIIREAKKTNELVFVIQTVIMRQNYKELPDLFEFAIKNSADVFWASYLEDAVNLPEIRMNKTDIACFREMIIPQMKNIVEKYLISEEYKKQLIANIDSLYQNEFSEYVYHEADFQCHWLGRHYTFYPNGTVYPCPGHEYFSSTRQHKVDYNNMDAFFNAISLKNEKKAKTIHCRYCPQGVFSDLIIRENRIYGYN